MAVTRLRAAHPEHVWVHDFEFEFDQTSEPRTLKPPNVTDASTKGALATELGRWLIANQTVEVHENVTFASRGSQFIPMNNGTRRTAHALRE